ncbi:winged helix-turn-helix transcriptional regulator [Rouxiella silvae]|uniref:winged helix-turn-helix transcriptional regulator n=1 Tax=Rouxiella silvae TaxID=1646373 RepID=UPI0009EA3E4B
MNKTSIDITNGNNAPIEQPTSELSFVEQVRRGELMSANCPSREVLRHITSRWGLLVLISLSEETLRFSELRRRIGGVSEKMLAQTLQSLEDDGFIDRVSYPVVPPHVEYSLTPLGIEVKEQVTGLAEWLESNLHRILKQRKPREAALQE